MAAYLEILAASAVCVLVLLILGTALCCHVGRLGRAALAAFRADGGQRRGRIWAPGPDWAPGPAAAPGLATPAPAAAAATPAAPPPRNPA